MKNSLLPEAENIAFLDDTLDDVSKGIGLLEKIAVGAAHLVGPDSVQAQLLKRGVKVDSY